MLFGYILDDSWPGTTQSGRFLLNMLKMMSPAAMVNINRCSHLLTACTARCAHPIFYNKKHLILDMLSLFIHIFLHESFDLWYCVFAAQVLNTNCNILVFLNISSFLCYMHLLPHSIGSEAYISLHIKDFQHLKKRKRFCVCVNMHVIQAKWGHLAGPLIFKESQTSSIVLFPKLMCVSMFICFHFGVMTSASYSYLCIWWTKGSALMVRQLEPTAPQQVINSTNSEEHPFFFVVFGLYTVTLMMRCSSPFCFWK